jgi:hypothetical protein
MEDVVPCMPFGKGRIGLRNYSFENTEHREVG